MAEPLVVPFVTGVTPTKWERIWKERMPRSPLELRLTTQRDALRSLRERSAQLAFLRDVDPSIAEFDDVHAIPLYREAPVVVAPRDSPVAAFDELNLTDLTGERILDVDADDPAAAVDLVAANVGLALMPQSVARVHARRDVVARTVLDAPDSGISLVWLRDNDDARIPTFIGIVRGRTQNSSR